MLDVRRAEEQDIPNIVKINMECFSGMRHSEKKAKKWVKDNFECWPKMQYYVIEIYYPLGYALWTELGGFREHAVVELEQIGIREGCRNMGFGTHLIEKSLENIKSYLEQRGSKLRLAKVISNERARNFYKSLGFKEEGVIKKMYRDNEDEYLMIRRFYGDI